ncbi:MAG: ribonuclease P protein component, partial [Clostridiales bacterium]
LFVTRAKLEDNNRLKKRKDFTKTYKKGRSVNGKSIILCYRRTTKPCFRIGFTVSKKVGNAVVRNKVRRRLKEIVRLNQECFANNYDYIFIARSIAKKTSYLDLEKEMLSLVKRVK